MLHSVGCPQPSAQVFIRNWNTSTFKSACVHGFIDANTGIVYKTLPWDHRGWHGGSGSKGSCNNTHIGVEMCEPAQIKYNGAGFTVTDYSAAIAAVRRTYDSAVELFAYLCKLYGLNPLTDICSHKEGCAKGIATNHGDPEHLWTGLGTGYTMDGFRKAVVAAMSGTVPQKTYGELAYDKLVAKGFIAGNSDSDVWKRYKEPSKVSAVLALIDKASGGMWTSDETDASAHWAQPHIISLCGKGIISDPKQWLENLDKDISNALYLALVDNMSGGTLDKYKGRVTDHWGRNHLDSLCDKALIATPYAWTDFNAAVPTANVLALLCNLFNL